jgi:curli biogenesis system outer membrane secretion channel CsgG
MTRIARTILTARGADDRRRRRRGAVVVLATTLAELAGCATEAHRALEPQPVASAGAPYQGPKSTLVVGKFDNRSSYLRGVFSDGVDRLGGQAKGILVTHLQQTGRFTVVEWDNLEEITRGGHQGSAAAAAERRGLRDCGRRGGVRPQGSR